MSRGDESVRRDAMALLDHLIVNLKAEEWSRAKGAVLLCTDLATGAITVHGPLPDNITDAVEYATEWEAELNKGATPSEKPPWNKGWKVTVYPLLPIEEEAT